MNQNAGEAHLDDLMEDDNSAEQTDEKATEPYEGRDEKPRDEERRDEERRDDESGDAPEMELGLCHYGGEGEPATKMAVRTDGTGWIAVCDEHTKDAEQDGFKVNTS